MNLSWLLPTIHGIPVLMYHKVWPGQPDSLTITPEKLRQQWTWLKDNGYTPLSLESYMDISAGKVKHYPKNSILITFDDGYVNNLTYVYPLLQEFGWKATFFIIADNVDGTAIPETGVDEKMTLRQLKQLNAGTVQLALHGYHHENFNQISLDEIKDVLTTSMHMMDQSGLQYYKILAYPYGARPKDPATLAALKAWMLEAGIEAAFRIGNQPSKIPAPDHYEIRRIDLLGTDTLEEFKTKLKKGKLKPF